MIQAESAESRKNPGRKEYKSERKPAETQEAAQKAAVI